ncbi:MAG: efflux RND transporter permease subunit [Planctomycetes bacterium]|nr:efflux RND transporter permease subunit [Planctomycetota bacterium]
MFNLNRVIAGSLRTRGGIAAVALVVSVWGLVTAATLPVDVLPDLNRPTVTVLSDAHGLVPEDVERLVTRPIEQAVAGATGVTRVRSSSGLGMSVVYVEFGWGTDLFRNRQIVQEKLASVRSQLPPDVVSEMAPVSSIMGQILQVGLRSKSGGTDTVQLRLLADSVVRPRLRSISGVAQVIPIGGSPRQMQVVVDARALRAFEVSLDEVEAAVRAANAFGSGGVLRVGPEGPLVTVPGLVRTPDDLAQAVVRSDPVRPITLSDVAHVEFGPSAVKAGEAGVGGSPGVILTVLKQPDADTVELTGRIHAELASLAPSLPSDVEVEPSLYEQAGFIHRAIENVEEAVRDGAILVVVILFLFLLNLRTTLITLTAIPLSIALTAIVFHIGGISINTMTLGGLAVAIGALVDDAIVDVENVFRRLRENRIAAHPLHPILVVYRASSEVRKPILVGTLLVVVVYAPLFALSGMEGRLFVPIGLAYVISILASLVVSLTVTPVLCLWLLPNAKATARRSEGVVVRSVKAAGGRAMAFSCRHPWAISGVVLAAACTSVFVLAHRGTEFLPPFNEGSAQINLILPPGASLDTSDAFGKRLEAIISGVRGVATIGRKTGRGEGDEHAEGVNFSEAIVSFDPSAGRSREDTIREIRERVADEFPGVATNVEQPLAHLLTHLLSGVNAQVAIKIFGSDFETLRGVARRVEAAVRPLPGVTDLFVEPQVLMRQINVAPRRDELARRGVPVDRVARTVELGMEGAEVARIITGPISYPVVVRLRAADRADVDAIRSLLVSTDEGPVRLEEVADVVTTWTPNNINHEDASRRIVVQHNVQGRSLGDVVADIERAIAPIRADLARTPGTTVRLSGQFEAQQEASRRLLWLSIAAFLAMFGVLYGHYRSINLAAQVLAAIPMAMIGAVFAIVATDQTVSIAVLVGLISLAGIAARNSILLVDHYLHVMKEERMPFGVPMILKAGKERLIPVLMTALCTGIALVPIALTPDRPGRELLYPVATVILGGLVSSTLLDLLVTPGLFLVLGRRAAKSHTEHREPRDRVAEMLIEDLHLHATPVHGPPGAHDSPPSRPPENSR